MKGGRGAGWQVFGVQRWGVTHKWHGTLVRGASNKDAKWLENSERERLSPVAVLSQDCTKAPSQA